MGAKIRKIFKYIFVALLAVFVLLTIELDRSGGFNYNDFPILLVLSIYSFLVFLLKLGSRFTFAVTLFFLLITSYWYIHGGAFITSERFGVWFYLFFLFGLIQSAFEIKMDTGYSFNSIRFYVSFAYFKLLQFAETYEGRRLLLFSEILHVLNALTGKFRDMPRSGKSAYITTIFGKFHFTGDLYGYSILAPAFERQDKNFLLRQIKQDLDKGKKVLFIDVGAYVGDYTVGLPFKLRGNNFSLVAFEPDPKYYALCRENIKLNGIANCLVQNIGLSNKTGTLKADRFPLETSKQKVTYRFKKMDDLYNVEFFRKYDCIYMKIDNEGNEEAALQGASKLVKSGVPVILMIEEAVNAGIITYLENNHWRFLKKTTPYNSFWELNHSK